jgi:CRISPR-associated endonuclease/helicase Cas3
MVSAYSITLKPVYSRPALEIPEDVKQKLPNDWSSLSWHQVATLEALRDPRVDVVFNSAMTGDGKSLAAYLAAMTGRNYTLAMYPTNELARDQEKQVQDYKVKFNPEYNPQIYRLSGAILEDFIATNKLPSKQVGLIDRANNSEILLTNPDIFHYIHNFYYLRRNKKGKGDNADKLFRRIDKNYKLFIFDEFHVFSSPQIASVINALLLIKHTSPGKKILFLSATPNELLQEFLAKAGFNYRVISPIDQDAYRFSPEDINNDWRQIAQPINLIFPHNLEPNLRSTYDWVLENAATKILKFFQDHPGSKGAIILNSIAAVKKLIPKFKSIFEPLGLKVRENTGLTGETEKFKSVQEADLLLGTSTIDVGVDFKINFLIFEASDAGNFIQRFGRLGRHEGFETYQAYALLPKFLIERLFEKLEHPLQDGSTYNRVTFGKAIREAYPFINEFKQYPQRWGGIQSACIYNELRATPQMREQYPQAAEKFGSDIQRTLGISIKQKFGQIHHCKNEGKQKIIDEARSFRGSSQLDCAIYDATNSEEPERDRFKTYNLPGILSNFTFEWLEKAAFLKQVEAVGLSTSRFEDALCYLKLTGYREVREDWYFYHSGSIDEIARSAKVQILKGLEVSTSINQISTALCRRCLVCFVSEYDRAYLRAGLGLPIHFQAYALSDRPHDKNPPYTIAFGQSALLLETLTWHWKPKEDLGWIC